MINVRTKHLDLDPSWKSELEKKNKYLTLFFPKSISIFWTARKWKRKTFNFFHSNLIPTLNSSHSRTFPKWQRSDEKIIVVGGSRFGGSSGSPFDPYAPNLKVFYQWIIAEKCINHLRFFTSQLSRVSVLLHIVAFVFLRSNVKRKKKSLNKGNHKNRPHRSMWFMNEIFDSRSLRKPSERNLYVVFVGSVVLAHCF